MVKKMFITPPDTGSDETCRTLTIPNTQQWLGIFNAAILTLADKYNYEQLYETDMTPEECAALAMEIYAAYLLTDACPTLAEPYWDDPEGDDAAQGESNPEFPFYEDVAQFVIAGFVLYATGSPTTALQFWTVAQQFRIAYRKHNLGGIIKVFMDAVQIGEVDTYAASPELGFFDVGSTGSTLRLEFPTPDTVTQVIRKRLWEQEIIGDTVRYVDGVWETFDTTTGTWIENPLADPRIQIMWRLPAGGGDNPRCLSAINLTAKFEGIINGFLLASSIVDACNAIVGIVLVFFPPARLLWVIIIAVVEALYAIGVATINAAFNFSAYDVLRCIIFDEIGEEGELTDGEKDAIYARIEAEMSSVQFGVLSLLINSLGTVGMNNAAQSRDEIGSCDDCTPDWCYSFFFEEAQYGWNGYDGLQGARWGDAWDPNGFIYPSDPANRARGHLYIDFPSFAAIVTSIEITRTEIMNGDLSQYQFANRTLYSTPAYTSAGITNTSTVQTFDFPADTEMGGVIVYQYNATATNLPITPGIITKIVLRGTGANPFGGDNC